MSKTDKTRPWWVRMAEIPMVTCRPVHDHRFGRCTLPAEGASRWHRTSGCHWAPHAGQVLRGDSRSEGREWAHFRREDRRRDRRQARRELRTSRGED